MKRYLKWLFAVLLFTSFFVVGIPIANASYNSKYLTETAPSDYYSGLNMNQTGEAFRRSLSAIISKNYKQHSYKTNNEVLAQTDPDPNKNGNIICFYTGQSLSGGWNKEHVWAKSHGFGTESWAPYCDAHHLRPTLSSINSSRSNSDFGEVSDSSNVSHDKYGNRWTGNTFEPRDEVKGDVARIMFYMATRYGFEAPYNLMLVDDPHTSISKTGNGRFGNLQTLLKWHYQDPVSSSEIYRNNVIFDDWQHNRNPYIDHPEFVDLAWPNEYSTGGGTTNPSEVDQEKVDHVMTLIASLPILENLTLSDKTAVDAAKASYDALTTLEKSRVYNYNSLEQALKKIKELENGGSTGDVSEDPSIVTGNVTVDFKNHGLSAPTNYSSNQTFKIGNHSFYASAMGVFSNELRIGGNKNLPPATVDSKYGLSSVSGVVLEQLFDVKNAKSLTMTINNHFGNLTKWYVLFKETGKSSYQVIQSKSESSCPTSISVQLPSPKDGRFVFIFCGDIPRLVLNQYTIETGVPSPTTLSDAVVSTSILAEVKNSNLVSAGLRFGGCFEKELFADASSYGVLVFDDALGEDTIEEWYEGGTYVEFLELIDGLFQYKSYDFTNQKAIVDENGVPTENGNYYQFSVVVNDIIGHEKTNLRAVIYQEINGVVYFSQEVETSYYLELLKLQLKQDLTTNEKDLVNFLLTTLQ